MMSEVRPVGRETNAFKKFQINLSNLPPTQATWVIKINFLSSQHFVFTIMLLNVLTSKPLQLVIDQDLGPVIQSVVSLTNLLSIISLTVLADSIYSIMIFFAEKM